MITPPTWNRRRFLTHSAAVAGVTLGFPGLLSRGALAAPDPATPNHRIRTGHIGVGGMGSYHLRLLKDQCVAICDVDQRRLAKAGQVVGPKARLYRDFRELLAQPEVDAVIIATPDHWHAVMTIMACEAGKDVYCEKPACCTIAEGRAMVNAAKRYERIIQIGSQGRSQSAAYFACAYLSNGMIGQVSRVNCWHYANPVGGFKPYTEPPPELDYDRWLGPLRWKPYNVDGTLGSFRWFIEDGGGQIRDRGAHVMSVVLYLMNADHTGPVRIEASGAPPEKGIYECPPDMEVKYTFTNPDWELHWSQPGETPAEAADLGNNRYGAKYWGDKGTLVVSGGDGGTDTELKAKRFHAPPGGPKIYRSVEHHQDFFNCVRTREWPIMNIEAAHRVASLCILGNLAWRLGRPLRWDPVAEKFLDDDQANLFLNRPGRHAWHI